MSLHFLKFGMISLENERDVEYSNLAAAWGVRVGGTLPGFLVVCLAGWLGFGTGTPYMKITILRSSATVVLEEHFLARLWCILQHFRACAES